jgi:hypothetical protein
MMFVTFLHDVCDVLTWCLWRFYLLLFLIWYLFLFYIIFFWLSSGYKILTDILYIFFTWSDLSHKLFQNIHRIVFNDSVDYNSCVNRSLYFTVPSVIPISDINDTECLKHTTQEIQLRCKVAALYRLIDLNGWSHGIFNHISVSMNNLY